MGEEPFQHKGSKVSFERVISFLNFFLGPFLFHSHVFCAFTFPYVKYIYLLIQTGHAGGVQVGIGAAKVSSISCSWIYEMVWMLMENRVEN